MAAWDRKGNSVAQVLSPSTLFAERFDLLLDFETDVYDRAKTSRNEDLQKSWLPTLPSRSL